jgi:hypothetical protein
VVHSLSIFEPSNFKTRNSSNWLRFRSYEVWLESQRLSGWVVLSGHMHLPMGQIENRTEPRRKRKRATNAIRWKYSRSHALIMISITCAFILGLLAGKAALLDVPLNQMPLRESVWLQILKEMTEKRVFKSNPDSMRTIVNAADSQSEFRDLSWLSRAGIVALIEPHQKFRDQERAIRINHEERGFVQAIVVYLEAGAGVRHRMCFVRANGSRWYLLRDEFGVPERFGPKN